MTTIHYGRSTCCELALKDCTTLGAERQENPPLSDPIAAIRTALARPNGYPSLAAATAPGDHVAVLVGRGLPQAGTIVRGALAALMDAGVNPELATVVSIDALDEQADLERELAASGAAGVRFEQHDPDDEQGLAMIGVTRAGVPLRFNRTMAEADFVLPLGLGHMPGGDDRWLGKYEGLFPEFSSRENSDRLRLQAASESAKERRKSAAQIDEAGWLAGVGMTVCIVPGAAGGIAAVLAGDPETVAREAAERARAIWLRTTDRPGDVVIAAVTGGEREQTWHNVACALAAASALVVPGGAIAICSELAQPPRGSLNRLKNAVDFGAVLERLSGDESPEARPARVLAQALDGGPVYLKSRLPADVVESLGMTPLESDAELSRLAVGRGHCVVIEEAQRLVPRLAKRDER
ncbi:MAG: DUF2088 domain-containing protein [Pirellulales bacterium]|nr:DUF2088 domain-containing protein [Pirellulales bacterium]